MSMSQITYIKIEILLKFRNVSIILQMNEQDCIQIVF